MPTIDLGSVTMSVDDGRVDVFAPFEHGELKSVIKSLNGRFNKDRRCWNIEVRFAKTDEEGVVRKIEQALLDSAPPKWPAAVAHFSGYACATKRFEVKFGSGGLRLMLPDGHPAHWTLDKLEGAARANKRSQIWTIPARSAKTSVVMPIIERMAREDKKAFIDAIEPYEGRTMKGTSPISVAKADELNLKPGRVMFAEFNFIKTADPVVVNMPVHFWPLMVDGREDKPGAGYEELEEGVALRLSHLPSEHGYKAVRKLMAMPESRRPQRLDAPHIMDKWLCRSKR